MSVSENLNKILSQIETEEAKTAIAKGSVKLLAVSKFHTIEEIEEAVKAGQKAFGENRVQEAYQKFTELYKKYPDLELHIIGQLQTNKVKKAVEIASVIESVDRIELLKEIEKQAAKLEKKIEVYFELHTAEDSKSGFDSFDSLKEAVDFCAKGNVPHVIPKGFMTMAPFTEDQNLVRLSFKKLKEASESLRKEYPELPLTELSMGMSGDFPIAIQEGSTEVRVGTAIFGERNYNK